MHFLYSSTSKSFRDIYEDLCLRSYFNIFKVHRARSLDVKHEMERK